MATVNIGSLKFNWKGAYNGSTAYAVDDVTEYNGSSYICILASTGNLPTNTTYFQPMATKGTDGTDVGTTLTTQGDILYRDGSGLQRLAAGTSGQLLQTGGAGANPSWTTFSTELVKLKSTSVTSTTATVDFDFTGVDDSVYHKYIFHVYARFDTGACTRVRIRQSGSTISSSHYNYALDYSYRNLSANSNHGSYGISENDTHWRFQDWSAATGNYEMATFELVKPQSTSNYKFITGNGALAVHSGNQYHPSGHSFSSYFHGNTNAWTGLHFYPSSGNFEDFEVVMHGLKK